MLVDEANISIKAGCGGDGVISFRREKFIPKGGPDGGDGGDGGDVYVRTDNNTDTLSYYQTHKQFQAQDGERGKKKKMHGKNGEDLTLKVPLGTIIYELKNDTKAKLADLTQNNQTILIARGGQGGLGNDRFKSATNQTPREFTQGEKGQSKQLFLELNMIADIGLIGLPNAGKSTLLKSISNAKPKTADYPFTTLIPNLGQVNMGNKKITVADIPGIVRDASKGKGLGFKFLRHISRTRLDIIILDVTSSVSEDYETLISELSQYDPEIIRKIKIIILNKTDLISPNELKKIIHDNSTIFADKKIIPISAKNQINIEKLLDSIKLSIEELDKQNISDNI